MPRLAAQTRALRESSSGLLDELDRLESLFAEREGELRAFVPEDERFGRLRRDARALLERHPDAASRPPLFGVAVGVKDALHVEGFATRAGSRLPVEVLRGSEGPCVAALKAAGALVLGKTVTTEFTYFAAGPTRNPHHPEHTPGGSSSGSAAAVGAGLSPLTLGTQTIASITRPAAFCGVVGFKPSYDRISRAGSIPLSPSFDHIGLFTADVAGTAFVAPLVVDGWTPRGAVKTVGSTRRPVLGVPEGPYLEHASAAGLDHFRDVCRRLEHAGYELRSVEAFADFADIRERHGRVVAAECARVHEEWYPRYRQLYREKTSELIRRGQGISAGELARDLEGREKLRGELTVLMDTHHVDLWISPAAPGPAPKGLDRTGDPVMSLPWTHSGLPTLAIPSGRAADGLPLGLQIAGRWYADEFLLARAGDIEEALG